MQIHSLTHTKSKATTTKHNNSTSLIVLSCSLTNEGMEHVQTKSCGQGSGAYNDGTQVTASRTKHSEQPGLLCIHAKAENDAKVLCSHTCRITSVLTRTNAFFLRTTGLDLRQQITVICTDSETHLQPLTDSNTQKPVMLVGGRQASISSHVINSSHSRFIPGAKDTLCKV